MRNTLTAFSLFAFAAAAPAGQPAACDYSPVTDPVAAYLQTRPNVGGVGLRVVQRGFVLHEQYWRTFNENTSIPIASATKLLSGIAIMTLVDDGLIDLDAPVSTYLPVEFPAGTLKGSMTVRQMFSHTAGLPGQSQFISDNTITLEEAVRRIGAQTPLIAPPGTEINYGGVSMHVAGRVAEVVTGQSWVALFNERVATPLALTGTAYDGLGVPTNPRIAGGARSSVEDFSHVLEMLAHGGVYEGVQVLSAQAVQTILADQTNGAAVGSLPDGVDLYLGYGIGNWIELRDAISNAPLEFTSPGAFGTTPWVNPALGLYGIFLVQDQLAQVDDITDDIRDFSRSFAQPLVGDLNYDGFVTVGDIQGFVLALTNPAAYAFVNPGCNILAADVNGDGVVSVGDIGAFVAGLTG